MQAYLKLFITDPLNAQLLAQRLIWARAALHIGQAVFEILNPAKFGLHAFITGPVNIMMAGLMAWAGYEFGNYRRWSFFLALLVSFLSVPLTFMFGLSFPEAVIGWPVIIISAILFGWLVRPLVHNPFIPRLFARQEMEPEQVKITVNDE
jgi:hypothetical protein